MNKNYICGHELYNILKSLEYVLYNNTNSTIKYKISHYMLKNINTYIFDNIIKKIDLTTILFDNIDFILINNSNKYIINLRNEFENYFINFNKYFYKLIKTINIDYIIDEINENYHNYNIRNNYIGKKNLFNRPYCLLNKRGTPRLIRSISNYGDKNIDYFHENKFTYFILKETHIFYIIRNNLFKRLKEFYENQIRILLLTKELRSYHYLFNKYLIRNISSYLLTLNIKSYLSLNCD
jgi:hypothetical protein